MLVGTSPRRVAIVGGVRIPFVRGNGAYAHVGNQEMLTAALRGVVERYGLQGQRLDDVAAGAVMKHSSQWNLTRESVLGSGLAAETPGLDLQRACGTSLEAAISARQQDRARPDRLRDCRGRRYRERSARGLPEELSAAVAAKLSRQDVRRTRCVPGSDCGRKICARCCRASPSRAPDCRWAKARNSW